jgi:hypothetical protein
VTPTVAVLAAALAFGPPAPVVHSQGDHVTAGRGSYCWSDATNGGGLVGICADTFKPPPVPAYALPARPGGRVQVDMLVETDSLAAGLRGREGSLRVDAVAGTPNSFVVRLPRRLQPRSVLDLAAAYPQGDAAFAVLLSNPLSAPPKPLLRAGGARLRMARGSYCWSRPPVGVCADAPPPVTRRALTVRHARVRVDMKMSVDVLSASIRHGADDLPVLPINGSKRRFRVLLPGEAKGRIVLHLFARYPQGDGIFGPRLRVR